MKLWNDFTAATCAISSYMSLRVYSSSKSFSNINTKKLSTNNQTGIEIVLWNKKIGINYMTFKSKLTNKEKSLLKLTPIAKSILIGLLLSDAWTQKHKHWNPRIGLKQSIKNFPYLWHVFLELGYLCSGLPMSAKNYIRGKLFYSVYIQTRQLQIFNQIFDLFYSTSNGKIIKTIKPELIFHLDYIVLAHWIMGDASKKGKGLVLCTDNFSLQEVVLLINMLILKFDVNSTLQKQEKHFSIYINEKNLIKIKPFILPYFVDHFLYKIN